MTDTNELCTHPTGALTITPIDIHCVCGAVVDLDEDEQLTEDEQIARMWAWRAAGEAELCEGGREVTQ